jgi:plastocyanin
MKKTFFFAGLFFLLTACSKDKSEQSNNPVNANTISMKNSAFSPPSLTININTTVTWINDDNMVHTVTADDGSFNSGDMAAGAKFTHTFSSTGTFNYHCVHHSGMVGTIISTGIR